MPVCWRLMPGEDLFLPNSVSFLYSVGVSWLRVLRIIAIYF